MLESVQFSIHETGDVFLPVDPHSTCRPISVLDRMEGEFAGVFRVETRDSGEMYAGI